MFPHRNNLSSFFILFVMPFIADLHIHSHFSIATSKELKPEYLDYWARIKGIKVIGTGDFTHPGWLKEMKEKLRPAEEGLFKLKEEYKIDIPFLKDSQDDTRFLLSAEISNIYKKAGKVRKVHNVLLSPDFETVEKIQAELTRHHFNIISDGRPILGMDSRDLLDLALKCSEDILFIPAHIWTPWFSALGAKSGFESITDCYGDLSNYIYAVEMGLSSDPPMNWLCSFLDNYTLLANSDAHSPEKLGRNANILNCPLTYKDITGTIKSNDPQKFLGTVNFFPQEGKYHFAGHRKCHVKMDPLETLQNNGICPVCHKPLTMGVLNRVVELSDRISIDGLTSRAPFHSLIPLKEILAELNRTGPASKKITREYQKYVSRAGSEFNILINHSLDEVAQLGNNMLYEAIRRMRAREVIISPGYDGEYGSIRLFKDHEIKSPSSGDLLFTSMDRPESYGGKAVKFLSLDLKKYHEIRNRAAITPPESPSTTDEIPDHLHEGPLLLNEQQKNAVQHMQGPALVIAGPGTGKTRVLTYRLLHLTEYHKAVPSSILAVTFTNKAAEEIRERVSTISKNRVSEHMFIGTFHYLGLSLLKKYADRINRKPDCIITGEADKQFILNHFVQIGKNDAQSISKKISWFKQNLVCPEDVKEKDLADIYKKYEDFLEKENMLDLEDLIYKTVMLLRYHPDIKKEIHSKYRWILVDEYQDINYSQYILLQLLTDQESKNLFAIGDPDQAIYGFRGSDIRFIKNFMDDFPEAKIYNLTTSYRCSRQILRASQDVISMPGNAPEGLTGIKEGVKINIVENATDKSEAEFIARTIEEMMGGLRFFSMDSQISAGEQTAEISSLSDFAVLCRTRRQMDSLEKAFHDHSIPYQSLQKSYFIEKQPAKSLVSLLKYLTDPSNSFLKYQLTTNQDLIVPRSGDIPGITELKNPDRIVDHLLKNHIRPSLKKDKEAVDKLRSFASEFEGTLLDFISSLSLGSQIDFHELKTEKVHLLTLHASKGLEFKCVFIAGCEEGLIPYTLFESQKTNPEEERRLLYVGMTRAMNYLWLSHSKKRFLMGRTLTLGRSRFIDRIEKDLLERKKIKMKKKTSTDTQLDLF